MDDMAGTAAKWVVDAWCGVGVLLGVMSVFSLAIGTAFFLCDHTIRQSGMLLEFACWCVERRQRNRDIETGAETQESSETTQR